MNRSKENGFTLIELLVVTAIIGLLGSIAVGLFAEYRESAHKAVVQRTVQDGSTALQTGMGDLEDQPIIGAYMVVVNDQPGPITHPLGATLVPGMTLSDNISFMALFNPLCTSAVCTRHFVLARHCESRYTELYATYGDGTRFHNEYTSSSGC